MSTRALTSKLAVITGGSSGIGRAIATRFASEGARCVLVGRNQTRLFEAVLELPTVENVGPDGAGEREQFSHGILVGDVSEKKTWEDVKRVYKDMDILVNAAGVAQNSFLFRTTDADIDEILDVNLRGTVYGCKTAAAAMLAAKKKGCIINISSLLATKGGSGASVYAASKAGVLGLTRSLCTEVGRFGIRVNTIVPGYIDSTGMTQQLDVNVLKAIPLARMGSPDEVADAAAFLARNQYANNCVLNLDGGLSAA